VTARFDPTRDGVPVAPASFEKLHELSTCLAATADDLNSFLMAGCSSSGLMKPCQIHNVL
jgi:hypothetical protein